MESESETETDVSTFLNAIKRIQMEMKHLEEFAEKLKIKQETDAMLQGISTSTKFAIENSKGFLDPEQLIALIKMISDTNLTQVLLSLKHYNRDEMEKIKQQLQNIPNVIRDNTKNEKKMEDKLIKRIQNFTEIIEKHRLQTQRQSLLDEFYALQQQEQIMEENSQE